MTELRRFIGLLQHFGRFIYRFSRTTAPLTNLTRKGIHKWDSSSSRHSTFWRRPCAARRSCRLPIFTRHLSPISMGPLSRWVRGTLTRLEIDDHGTVVAYLSKRQISPEDNYSSNDQELLGLLYFLRKFQCHLKRSEFEVINDKQFLKCFLWNRTLFVWKSDGSNLFLIWDTEISFGKRENSRPRWYSIPSTTWAKRRIFGS